MAREANQWYDDEPSCGRQAATPQPRIVYSSIKVAVKEKGLQYNKFKIVEASIAEGT
jgi:hypothetical protein